MQIKRTHSIILWITCGASFLHFLVSFRTIFHLALPFLYLRTIREWQAGRVLTSPRRGLIAVSSCAQGKQREREPASPRSGRRRRLSPIPADRLFFSVYHIVHTYRWDRVRPWRVVERDSDRGDQLIPRFRRSSPRDSTGDDASESFSLSLSLLAHF